MGLKALLPLCALVAGCTAEKSPSYTVQANGMRVPELDLSQGLLEKKEISKEGISITVHKIDRNNDRKADLAMLYIRTSKGDMRQIIDDNNLDGLADWTYIDNFNNKGEYGKPDGIYDMGFSTEMQCEGVLEKKPTKDSLEFENFLDAYTRSFK